MIGLDGSRSCVVKATVLHYTKINDKFIFNNDQRLSSSPLVVGQIIELLKNS